MRDSESCALSPKLCERRSIGLVPALKPKPHRRPHQPRPQALIDCGTFFAATLRQHGLGDYPAIQRRQFGTTNVALILARIARGLPRGAALEAQRTTALPASTLQHDRALLAPPALARNRPNVAATHTTRRTNPRYTDDDTLLAHLPTQEQIAEEIRHRPIGEVIADICCDLGIVPAHSLWRELEQAIMRERSRCARPVQRHREASGPIANPRRLARRTIAEPVGSMAAVVRPQR